MKEVLAVSRVNKIICGEFKMLTGLPATNKVVLGILEEAQSATGFKIDKTILKNDAGVIKESQVKKIQKTIFELDNKKKRIWKLL